MAGLFKQIKSYLGLKALWKGRYWLRDRCGVRKNFTITGDVFIKDHIKNYQISIDRTPSFKCSDFYSAILVKV